MRRVMLSQSQLLKTVSMRTTICTVMLRFLTLNLQVAMMLPMILVTRPMEMLIHHRRALALRMKRCQSLKLKLNPAALIMINKKSSQRQSKREVVVKKNTSNSRKRALIRRKMRKTTLKHANLRLNASC